MKEESSESLQFEYHNIIVTVFIICSIHIYVCVFGLKTWPAGAVALNKIVKKNKKQFAVKRLIHLSLYNPAGISCWNRNLPHCWVWSSGAPGCPVAGSWTTRGWRRPRWTPSSPRCYRSQPSCELQEGGEEIAKVLVQPVALSYDRWRRKKKETGGYSLGPVKEMQKSVMGSSFDVSMPLPPSNCTESPASAHLGVDLCEDQHVAHSIHHNDWRGLSLYVCESLRKNTAEHNKFNINSEIVTILSVKLRFGHFNTISDGVRKRHTSNAFVCLYPVALKTFLTSYYAPFAFHFFIISLWIKEPFFYTWQATSCE